MIFTICDFIYILFICYLILAPYTIYDYNINYEKIQIMLDDLKVDRNELEKDRDKLRDDRNELEKDRDKLERDRDELSRAHQELLNQQLYLNNISLFFERERKKLKNNNISMWSDEDDWSENNIEDIDDDDFF